MTVYFVECAGRIKIGYAKDVKDRLKGLSTSAAHDLTLLCSLEGSVHFERAIHAALKPYRLRGEWFEDCAAVRALMADLKLLGGTVISFVEPPVVERRSVPRDLPAFESPLRPVYNRINACMDRYIGHQVSAALKQETELGLEKGAIANRRIGGHYTTERAVVAVVLIKDTMAAMEQMTSVVFESILVDEDPIEQTSVLLPAVECVERLERGLAALFAPSKLETLDMSGYAN